MSSPPRSSPPRTMSAQPPSGYGSTPAIRADRTRHRGLTLLQRLVNIVGGDHTEDYEGAGPRPVSRGGGSVLGTPPSMTCSVHSDPDQYRRSCRPVGSVSQQGAIPVKVTSPDDGST